MPRLNIIDPSVYSNPKSSFKEALGEIMPSRHDVRLRIGQPFQLKPLPKSAQFERRSGLVGLPRQYLQQAVLGAPRPLAKYSCAGCSGDSASAART